MMYLRHEAGHVFNYAFKPTSRRVAQKTFGATRSVRDDYKPMPFSRSTWCNISGWYAQKHPDEDFAETFAVWLTPDSNWEQRYKGWAR